jgi:hypothetical protein
MKMDSTRSKSDVRPLVISLFVSAAVLLAGMVLIQELSSRKMFLKLLWPLMRLMGLICIGLVAGQVIEASGWTKALSILARPMFAFSNLGNRCSAAFMSAFVSGVASNAMLFEFYQEGKISRQQLYLSNFVNQLPAFFLHLPTTFFVVIPLTGRAGVLYFILQFLAAMLRTFLFLLYGHLRLPRHTETFDDVETSPLPKSRSARDVWLTVKSRLPRRLMRIGIYVVPIYIAVFIANSMGLFEWLRTWLAKYVVTTFIPMESLSVVILSLAAEFTSGFAAAGALMNAGVLTVKQTVVALLIGNIIAFPFRALRHQLPNYMGIFSPKMGAQLLLMGQAFRIASLILVGAVYFVMA